MNIAKQMTELLKSYINGKLDREALNFELRKIYLKIFESQRHDEQKLYAIIIHHIAIAVPEFAYNEDEIKYVYKALVGEEGYTLKYVLWIHTDKNELSEAEQKILKISQNYVNNYQNKIQFQVFNNQTSYLDEGDRQFIRSMYTNTLLRNEFGEATDIQNDLILCLLDLLKIGSICHPSQHHDTNRYVMEKIKYFLSLYHGNVPICCNASLQNGIPTFILC